MTRRPPHAPSVPVPVEEDPRRLAFSLPIDAQVRLAHAAVQRLATEHGLALLHLKGPAVLPGLRPEGRLSTDADVLVDPDQVAALRTVLGDHGWSLATSAQRSSPFGHAENWWHSSWGMVDVHSSWPGTTVDPRTTFDALCEDALTIEIAHVPCRVPGRVAQIFVLLLHGARSISPSDKGLTWDSQDAETRAAVVALAERLGAEVAMAAATGDLDAHRDDADYDLWRYYRDGGSRLDEWRARYRAARGPSARARVLLHAVRVDRDYLGHRLGHRPTRREVLAAQVHRLGTAVRDVLRDMRGRRR